MENKNIKRWWVCIFKDLFGKFFFLYTDKIDDILTVNILSYWGNYCEGGGYCSLCDRPINAFSYQVIKITFCN